MYQSPIKINTDTAWPDGIVKKAAMDVGRQTDEIIMTAVIKVGVEVDKEELIRALRFDCGQYQKGYSDGWAAADQSIVRCQDCMYSPSGTDDGENKGFGLEWPHDDWPEENPCPCKCGDGWYSRKPKPDFFCANGMAADAIEEDADELR